MDLKAVNRILTLDLIRGCALVGIGIENVIFFNSENDLFTTYSAHFPDSLNQNLVLVFMLFIRSKCYPVFALLFGLSAALALEQKSPMAFIYRSLFIGFLGLLQIVFIWNGDVLLQYAFLSILFFAFRKLPSKILLPIATACFIISFYGFFWPQPEIPGLTYEETTKIFRHGSFLSILKNRLLLFSAEITSVGFWLFLSRIFAFLLLGFVLGKEKFFYRFLEEKTALKTLLLAILVFVLLGLLLQLNFWRGEGERELWQESLKRFLMAGFFFANVALLILLPLVASLKLPFDRFLWHPLALMGRMTLTLYLMQNLIFSLIFYGYGAGVYGLYSPATLWFSYFCFIVAQMLFTVWWLRRFQQGPLEYLLRKVVNRLA